MITLRYAKSILAIIEHSGAHLTAEQIFFQLKKQYPSVVMATVYNNLNALYQQGCVRKISLEGYADRYDKNTRHDHLVCRQCGALSDLHLADLAEQLESQIGFPIDGYDLKVQYLCPHCRQAQESFPAAVEPQSCKSSEHI